MAQLPHKLFYTMMMQIMAGGKSRLLKHMKHKFLPNIIQNFSAYHAGNTLRLCQEGQGVNTV
jgi:hypothetical protein